MLKSLWKSLWEWRGHGAAIFFLHTNGLGDKVYLKGRLEAVDGVPMRGVAMKKEILLTIVFLFLAQGVFSSGWDAGTIGSREAAASPALKVKSIHPLPEWDNPADLQPRGTAREAGSSAGRLKISFPVGLLATLLFFLMWKFLQSQE